MPPEKSGYYYPNKFARIFLDAMEEVMGKNGLNAVLHLAELDNLIGNYPPDNLDKVFDFADFTALVCGAGRNVRAARWTWFGAAGRADVVRGCVARVRCVGGCG